MISFDKISQRASEVSGPILYVYDVALVRLSHRLYRQGTRELLGNVQTEDLLFTSSHRSRCVDSSSHFARCLVATSVLVSYFRIIKRSFFGGVEKVFGWARIIRRWL